MASPDDGKEAVSSNSSNKSYIYLGVGIALGMALVLVLLNFQMRGQVFQQIIGISADDVTISDPEFIKKYESILRVGAYYKSTMAVGEEGSFSGGAKGGTEPYTYQWKFDDGKIVNGQNVARSFDTPGKHTFVLTVNDAKGKHDKADNMYVDVNQ
jgi:hypothetical protein